MRLIPKVAFVLSLAGFGTLTATATAQSFCDLLPAAQVQATLGLSTPLTATPDTKGGNGCDYKVATPGPVTVMADTGSYTSYTKMLFDQRLKHLGPTASLVPGVGQDAFYEIRAQQQMPKYPGTNWTQQSVVFRINATTVSFIVMTPDPGVKKEAVLALAQMAISKHVETLKQPSN